MTGCQIPAFSQSSPGQGINFSYFMNHFKKSQNVPKTNCQKNLKINFLEKPGSDFELFNSLCAHFNGNSHEVDIIYSRTGYDVGFSYTMTRSVSPKAGHKYPSIIR